MARKEDAVRVWPRPQEIGFSGKALELDGPLRLRTMGRADWLEQAAQSAADALRCAAGHPFSAKGGRAAVKLIVADMDALPPSAGLKAVRKPEGYALSITDRGILLAGEDAVGIFYGAQTLAQLLKPCEGSHKPRGAVLRSRSQGAPSLPGVRVRDWPSYRLRGCHLYLPGRKQFDFFRRLLDFLAAHKYNTLILEISGGLEYDRHPEVSAAWKKFCREVGHFEPTRRDVHVFKQRHPRGPCAMQNSRYHPKDSTHTELAGGDCLTKDELRQIVLECRKRHIEIIPEMQALTHSYWLCCAHPEIAERRDDPFPDTYCPSNPRSYELYGDCVDEVIEIVHPRMVSIGHDEMYTVGLCPRCRGKSGHDLLAGELNKLHAWFAARGIRMMMWGDMLMNFKDKDGVLRGGVTRKGVDPWTGKSWSIPAAYKAADRVPKDLVVGDWYWSLDPKSERHFHEHGFEVMYGNFSPRGFEKWETRARVPYVLGAEISTWCEVSEYAFAHNGIFHAFFTGSDMLWRGKRMSQEELSPLTARRMTPMMDRLTGRNRWLASGGAGKVRPVDLQGAVTPVSEFLAGKVRCGPRLTTITGTATFRVLTRADGVLYKGIVLGKSNPKAPPVAVGRKAKRLLVLHGTTMEDVFFQPTFYSYHRGPAEILKYVVAYADGRKAEFQAYFGEDIGPVVGLWPQRAGVCFRAVPVPAGPGHTLYAQEWVNPRPKSAIASITAVVGKDAVEKGDILVAAMNTVE